MRPKRFLIEPYKDSLTLFCPCSKEQAMNWLRRHKLLSRVDIDDYDGTDAVTFYHETLGNIVFMHRFDDSAASIGVLVHELCHVTFNVLNSKGVKEEAGNEEAAAYLLDNLVEKCVRYLRSQAKQS